VSNRSFILWIVGTIALVIIGYNVTSFKVAPKPQLEAVTQNQTHGAELDWGKVKTAGSFAYLPFSQPSSATQIEKALSLLDEWERKNPSRKVVAFQIDYINQSSHIEGIWVKHEQR